MSTGPPSTAPRTDACCPCTAARNGRASPPAVKDKSCFCPSGCMAARRANRNALTVYWEAREIQALSQLLTRCGGRRSRRAVLKGAQGRMKMEVVWSKAGIRWAWRSHSHLGSWVRTHTLGKIRAPPSFSDAESWYCWLLHHINFFFFISRSSCDLLYLSFNIGSRCFPKGENNEKTGCDKERLRGGMWSQWKREAGKITSAIAPRI